jgi:hypothetical protein
MVAASEADLTPELAAFIRFAGNYFDVVVAWYERIKSLRAAKSMPAHAARPEIDGVCREPRAPDSLG